MHIKYEYILFLDEFHLTKREQYIYLVCMSDIIIEFILIFNGFIWC